MTMNKTWLAAIAIALASSTQVQARDHKCPYRCPKDMDPLSPKPIGSIVVPDKLPDFSEETFRELGRRRDAAVVNRLLEIGSAIGPIDPAIGSAIDPAIDPAIGSAIDPAIGPAIGPQLPIDPIELFDNLDGGLFKLVE